MPIISLTSIPPRFPGLGPVLQSLVDQPECRVVLAIPQAYVRFPGEVVPPEVPQGVKLLRCEDWGPVTKVLAVREAYPDEDILYCDDDCLYGPNWAAQLGMGEGVRAGAVFDVSRLKREGGVVAQGFAGVHVPAHVPLPDHVPEEVWRADDLWLSAWFEAHRVPITEVAKAREAVRPLARDAALQDEARPEIYAKAAAYIFQTLTIWPPAPERHTSPKPKR